MSANAALPSEREEQGIAAGSISLHAVIDRPSGAAASARAPVVVLHGFTGDASTMQVAADALAGERTVVRIEMIGHGASDAPRGVDEYRMEACIEQLEACCERLELGRPHWIGYSMGGRTALCMAALRPSRVRSLTLVGASAGLPTRDEREARMRADEALAASHRGRAEGLSPRR